LLEKLLQVNNLQTAFRTDKGTVNAIDDICFHISPRETLGIVGESGCGKSVTALSILRILGARGRTTNGQILFHDQDLLQLSERAMCDIRGKEISMIFQEPMTALDPLYTIGSQMAEAAHIHLKQSREKARELSAQMLSKVGLPDTQTLLDRYPHMLSGGMRQRVMIAMALLCSPQLLIADEPTTALDVTIQAQILRLLMDIREQYGTSILLITHDLGVIAEMADRVIVMYAGQIVEEADVFTLFDHPAHPYTLGLMKSIPNLVSTKLERLNCIPGSVPSSYQAIRGCRFYSRCPMATARCANECPPLYEIGSGHFTRCFLGESEQMKKEGAL